MWKGSFIRKYVSSFCYLCVSKLYDLNKKLLSYSVLSVLSVLSSSVLSSSSSLFPLLCLLCLLSCTSFSPCVSGRLCRDSETPLHSHCQDVIMSVGWYAHVSQRMVVKKKSCTCDFDLGVTRDSNLSVNLQHLSEVFTLWNLFAKCLWKKKKSKLNKWIETKTIKFKFPFVLFFSFWSTFFSHVSWIEWLRPLRRQDVKNLFVPDRILGVCVRWGYIPFSRESEKKNFR